MSRNFELLQQVAGNPGAAGTTVARSSLPLYADNAREQVAHLKLEGVAREETLRLVQSMFFTAAELHPPRVVMFSGIDSGNGCSHVCAYAGSVLADNVAGSVCLLDANFRTPDLPDFFGVANHYGLTDSLRSHRAIRDFVTRLGPENLWLLSCGSHAADSTALMNSEVMKARVAELRKEFDYVLIDSPPLNTFSDGVTLGRLVDGAVLVLEAGLTRREAILKVSADLRAAQIKILGAVLNKRTFAIPEALYRRL
jgi:capsular exopolysaccharide synthesis family protein